MYEINYSESAVKYIKKLPRDMQMRILMVLERARIRPEAHFERLVGLKLYKLRVGDHRIIADINSAQVMILILKAGHRRNIYDVLSSRGNDLKNVQSKRSN